jgi:hypothetical protein
MLMTKRKAGGDWQNAGRGIHGAARPHARRPRAGDGVPHKRTDIPRGDRRTVSADAALMLACSSADFWLTAQRRMDLQETPHSQRRCRRIERAPCVRRAAA